MADKFDKLGGSRKVNNPLDRRTVLGSGAVMMGGLIAGQMLPGVAQAAAAKKPAAARRPRTPSPSASSARRW